MTLPLTKALFGFLCIVSLASSAPTSSRVTGGLGVRGRLARFGTLRATGVSRREPSHAEVSGEMPPASGKKKVLFVCLGNICRSPTAEAVFKKVTEDAGVASDFEIDSCGTGGGLSSWYRSDPPQAYHEGDPADPRMTRAASSRGIQLTSISRPLTRVDLESQDHIIVMDKSNFAEVRKAAEHWGSDYARLADKKTSMMLDYTKDSAKKGTPVPDPYYGGPEGFDRVLDLLEEACVGLLNTIR
ncbi:hypothetical protein AAMO2058_000294000 [Amorphochlora amoebiformis]